MIKNRVKNKCRVIAAVVLAIFVTILAADSGVSGAPEKKPFGGEQRISVDYKDVDVGDVLRSLSYTYGLNLVTSSEVKGKITISLKDVSVAEALDAILSANGYNYSQKGSIYYISPGSIEGAQAVTEAVTLKYLKASDAQNLVRKVLSGKGDIKVDEISNMLVVTDYPASIAKLKTLLKDVDQPPRQVLIEAKILDITSKDLQNLGVTWEADYSPGHGIFGRSTNTAEEIKVTQTLSGTSSSVSGGQFKLDTLVMKGLTATATIDALVQTQKAHLLASPSIAVLNNREARIIIGEKVPYKEKMQTTTGTTETTKYIDVGTTLRVTPSINADGYITLSIHPEVSSVSALLDAGPRITTREADTVVRVKEGETIVIGGLIKQEDNRIKSRIPVLGYIPILEYLFSSKSRDQTQTELAVFITPKILLSRAERLSENKTRYEEEAYVNILSTAGVNVQMKLFDKARKLQTGDGFEANEKAVWQRRNQALSIYEYIVTQFPDGPKAAESAYQSAVLYNLLGEYGTAKTMCEKILSEYPSSPFAVRADRLRKAMNARLRREKHAQARKKVFDIKTAADEQREEIKKDEAFYTGLQKIIERDALENDRREKAETAKQVSKEKREERLSQAALMRQALQVEREMSRIYRLKESREAEQKAAEERRAAEQERKRQLAAERAEQARLKAEALEKAKEEAAVKREAEQKAAEERRAAEQERKRQLAAERAEQARLKAEALEKAKEEAAVKREAEQKAAEERRVAEQERKKQLAAEQAEQARLKAEALEKAKEEAAVKREAEQKAAEERRAAEQERKKQLAAERAEQARLKAEVLEKAKEEAAVKREAEQKAAEERRAAEQERKKQLAAEQAEQARLKAEVLEKAKEEAAVKREAKQKAAEERRAAEQERKKQLAAERAEQARLKAEALEKAKEEAAVKREAKQKAAEERRAAEQERKRQLAAERAEQARLKAEAFQKAKAEAVARIKAEQKAAEENAQASEAKRRKETQ